MRFSSYVGTGRGHSTNTAVEKWLVDIVLKYRLCPWASQSMRKERIRIVTSNCTNEASLLDDLISESKLLCNSRMPPLSTTLLVCPHIATFNEFNRFESFVQSANKLDQSRLLDTVSLVAFHPEFSRWIALPSGIQEGDHIMCYFECEEIVGTEVAFSRSNMPECAVLISYKENICGVRKVLC